jgi:ribulose bisphosphate carboxylase small subunit
MFYDELSKEELQLRLETADAKLVSIQHQRDVLDEVEALVNEHRQDILRILGVIVLDDHREPSPEAEWIG